MAVLVGEFGEAVETGHTPAGPTTATFDNRVYVFVVGSTGLSFGTSGSISSPRLAVDPVVVRGVGTRS